MDDSDLPPRPKVRGDCERSARPCPWVGCQYHLYLSIMPSGALQIEFPELEPWELEHSCALDVADDGPKTLYEVGVVMNVSRERVRQIQKAVQERLQRVYLRDPDLVVWARELRILDGTE